MEPSDDEADGPVVVGFDGGWRMKNLLRITANEATRRGTTLAIVTVSRPELDPDLGMSGRQHAERRAEAVARQHLTEAVASVKALNEQVTVTTHYLTEEEAQATHPVLSSAQLLAVATVGQYGRRAFELESVSRILLKSTRCPVLVVPEEDSTVAGRHQLPAVIAGIGEHASDAAVIQAAWAESERRGCGLEILHAYRALAAETPGAGLRRSADVVARTLDAAGVTPSQGASVLLSCDDPAIALTRRAGTGSARLLVIGSRPGSLSGLVLGSVGREILSSLPTPLLVIPDPASRPGARTAGVGAQPGQLEPR